MSKDAAKPTHDAADDGDDNFFPFDIEDDDDPFAGDTEVFPDPLGDEAKSEPESDIALTPPTSSSSTLKIRTKADESAENMSELIDQTGTRNSKFLKLMIALRGSVAAQCAVGKGKPKERLVRHQKGKRQPPSLKAILRALWRMIIALLPMVAPLIAFRLWGGEQTFLRYLQGHLGLVLMPVLPVLAAVHYAGKNRMRTHPPQPKKGPRRKPQAPLPPTRQHVKDVNDIIANLDHFPLRLAYWTLTLSAIFTAGKMFPLTIAMFEAAREKPDEMTRPILLALIGPVVAFTVPRLRTSFVIKQRWAEIEDCYNIAKATLGYIKRLPANPRSREVRECTPWLAINVKKWSALYEMDEFFVLAPETLSVERISPWDEFTANLNIKMPRPEEWRIEKDERGRGATALAANYPIAVLWDGEYDPDPLTFFLGVDLDTGNQQVVTLSDASPHVAISGGTSSGKPLSLLSFVATEEGFKQVKDLRVGDRIATPSGEFAPISGMSDIETPETAYRLTFHDGTTEVASGTHLWTTWDRSARRALSRQRKQGYTRARTPWLSDEQRALLAAEIEMTSEGDDISLPQVAALLGVWKDTPPLVQTAQMIGVCRRSTVTREFVYADQVVQQEQTCMVFDRAEVPTLVTALANSPRAAVREAAKSVKVLEKNGQGPVSIPDLTRVTGIDRTRMRGLVKRSGVTTLRKEKVMLARDVPGKVISRTHPTTVHYYPKRPLLEALIQRGMLDGRDQRHKMALPAVRTTQEIADTLRYRAAGAGEDAASWANHSVPRCAPVQFPERDDLPMDPYAMGAWLGEGISSGESLIPDTYLYASIPQRLALLQGFMDASGMVNETSGECEFPVGHLSRGSGNESQSDEALARQVRSLVASLGMIAYIRRGEIVEADTGLLRVSGDESQSWIVSFSPTMQVFRLPRKAALIDPEAVRAKAEQRYIVSVEPIEPEPMRCIMVDSDEHQFLVGDQYVPTHNTSAMEIIAAQMLIKPMPWDENLRGMVVIVDPKGPLARRWMGRPGVVVANGQEDAAESIVDPETGEEIVPTGIEVMASCMQWIEAEHQRRQSVLKRYPDVATWVHLPDEVKKAERFFPILVVLDEYIDHTDKEKANGDERIIRENNARDVITRLASWHARKYRNVGMHTALIAQEVKMTGNTGIGSALMRQLPVRIVTGQMDPSQLLTMFGPVEVPSLPSSRMVIENGERRMKTIPGRARIMNAMGQQIHKVQIMFFGGKTNSDTLDKWLPRGTTFPNGDFSIPPERPRTASDFDEEGNYIGTTDVVSSIVKHEHPMTEKNSVAEFDPTRLPEYVDDEEGNPIPPRPKAVRPKPDNKAIFPAAKAEAPRCQKSKCVNDASEGCPNCRKRFCDYHMTSAPDPASSALICSGCYDKDPLVKSGIKDVYDVMFDLGTQAGLLPSYLVDPEDTGDDCVMAVVATSVGPKVVQVVARKGVLEGRSRSGVVHGDEVIERVETAITNFAERAGRGK